MLFFVILTFRNVLTNLSRNKRIFSLFYGLLHYRSHYIKACTQQNICTSRSFRRSFKIHAFLLCPSVAILARYWIRSYGRRDVTGPGIVARIVRSFTIAKWLIGHTCHSVSRSAVPIWQRRIRTFGCGGCRFQLFWNLLTPCVMLALYFHSVRMW